MTIRASVIGGRLVVDQPTSLPEGTVLDLVIDDEGDDLDDADRLRLHAALDEAMEQASRADWRDGKDVLADLRRRR